MGKIPNCGEEVLANIVHGNWPAGQLRLYAGTDDDTDDAEIGDFNEATFSGYAAENFGSADLDAPVLIDGKWVCVGNNFKEFEHNGGAVDQVIVGWYITAGGVLIAFGAFPNSATMEDTGDLIKVKPTVRVYDPGGA
jgi:hypothetical protein